MTILTPLFGMLALAAAPAAPADGGGGAGSTGARGRIVATVAHSEWTPPGEVSLDLRTGRYRLRLAPSRLAPSAPVRMTRGRLSAAELQPLREASAEARAQGLIHSACRDNGRPEQIVIGNGSTIHMRLTGGGAPLLAPGERGCWTEAATNLHRQLDATFGARARPRR
jgi:hypothetical protein